MAPSYKVDALLIIVDTDYLFDSNEAVHIIIFDKSVRKLNGLTPFHADTCQVGGEVHLNTIRLARKSSIYFENQ